MSGVGLVGTLVFYTLLSICASTGGYDPSRENPGSLGGLILFFSSCIILVFTTGFISKIHIISVSKYYTRTYDFLSICS